MILLFVSEANPFGAGPFGGAEVSMRLLAEGMAERGHRVTILCFSDRMRDGEAVAESSPQYLPQGIRLVMVRRIGRGLSGRAGLLNSLGFSLILRWVVLTRRVDLVF